VRNAELDGAADTVDTVVGLLGGKALKSELADGRLFDIEDIVVPISIPGKMPLR